MVNKETVRFDLAAKQKQRPIRIHGTVHNQFAVAGHWLRGTLHCHLEDAWVDEAQDAYRALGYDFMPGMDHSHDVIPLKPRPDMIVIPGAEIGHLLVYGLDNVDDLKKACQHGDHFTRTLRMIQLAKEQGALTALAHPLWTGWSWEELQQLCDAGLCGLEIINGPTSSGDTGYSDQIWHLLLTPQRFLAAMASDDTSGLAGLLVKHSQTEYRSDIPWTGLLAQEKSPAGVLAAIAAGRTYASIGPRFEAIELSEDGKLVVHCSPCRACYFRGRQFHYGGDNVHPPEGQDVATEFVFDFVRSGYRVKDYVVVILEDSQGRKAYLSPLRLDLEVEYT